MTELVSHHEHAMVLAAHVAGRYGTLLPGQVFVRRRRYGRFRTAAIHEMCTPLYARTRGVLTHRVRWVDRTWHDRVAYHDTAETWCGSLIGGSDGWQPLTNHGGTICHQCEDRAVIAGGLQPTDALPAHGCELSIEQTGKPRWKRGSRP